MNIISIAKYRSAHQTQKIDLDKEHAPTRSVPAASEPGGLLEFGDSLESWLLLPS